MEKIVNFPNTNEKVSLYTETHIYSGTITPSTKINDRAVISLSNASIVPIAKTCSPSEVLKVDYVSVLWDKVVAFGNCIELI